ncbi:hypothetical protein KXW39_007876 [Aspergillus fumigatus]|nr:hypothetical protein KXX06_009694 [Aspergillus fumigatus]KAH1753468.1 hypothetical protein KXX56_008805 [Aspergillus fumigatus]KAH2069028.1 hypothetical protein KXX03_009555 [Aspergillus fumigatus]KAH3058931.1 hypothetical protein KXW16_002916 [Aspergillus fumigatus]KAH3308854.1 hypothetical protein KXV87_005884 [Aspergillus fumigatus]
MGVSREAPADELSVRMYGVWVHRTISRRFHRKTPSPATLIPTESLLDQYESS